MSPEGRRRLTFSIAKVCVYITALVCIAWTGWKIAAVFQDNISRMPLAAKAEPIKKFELFTNGVLTTDWLVKTLALPKGTSLMELDLMKLKARILANGQVMSANLERNFPANLSVRITERTPVARVKAQIDSGPAKELTVARDGVVYAGTGYDSKIIDTLPWLDGIKLVKEGTGFAPIAGMPLAASLIADAENRATHLYTSWQVVSLERVLTDNEILVRTNTGVQIIFSATLDNMLQLGRLDTTLDLVKAQGDRPIKQIDLTLGAQVDVSFADVVPAANGKSSGKTSSILFSLQNPRPKT